MAGVGASVGKVRSVLTVVAEHGARREDVWLVDDVVRAREGARRMLTAALEAEVHAYLAELAGERDDRSRRLVVRRAPRREGHPRGDLQRGGQTARPVGREDGHRHVRGEVPQGHHEDHRRPRCVTPFYDYQAEHWIDLRTTNPIESTFATVCHRTRVTKGPGSRAAGLAMAFELIESAQLRWRAVNASQLVGLVRAGPRLDRGYLVERPEAVAA